MAAWKGVTANTSTEAVDKSLKRFPATSSPIMVLEYSPTCQHDFIVHPTMVPIAVDFVIRAVRRVTLSRL